MFLFHAAGVSLQLTEGIWRLVLVRVMSWKWKKSPETFRA